MPGLHDHCRCKLVCVEEIDSGWTFTDQFSHVAGVFNVDGSISHDPAQPGPQHLSKKNREEAEGAEDIAPVYVPPPYHYDAPAQPAASYHDDPQPYTRHYEPFSSTIRTGHTL